MFGDIATILVGAMVLAGTILGVRSQNRRFAAEIAETEKKREEEREEERLKRKAEEEGRLAELREKIAADLWKRVHGEIERLTNRVRHLEEEREERIRTHEAEREEWRVEKEQLLARIQELERKIGTGPFRAEE